VLTVNRNVLTETWDWMCQSFPIQKRCIFRICNFSECEINMSCDFHTSQFHSECCDLWKFSLFAVCSWLCFLKCLRLQQRNLLNFRALVLVSWMFRQHLKWNL
jgi:hypothetical protein